MDSSKDFLLGRNTILPVEDEILFPKAGTSSGSSDLCFSDEVNERKEFENLPRNEFDEVAFFGGPVLNMNGGLFSTNEVGEEYKGASDLLLRRYFKPDLEKLSNIHNFVVNDKSNSLTSLYKPVTETDQLVKLMHERKPYFESRKNIIIAQKPFDKMKSSGRLSFGMADVTLIEKHSNIKMFLRDVAANEVVVSDLNTVSDKNMCLCFDDHNKSLFCVRSRYEEDVKVLWSEDKSLAYININTVDDSKFELLFTPLVCQSILKNSSGLIMQLVFQMENDCEILEQSYFIKFCAFPKRDVKHFIKTLVKENLVDDTLLEKTTKSPVSGLFYICKVELDEEHHEEFKKFVKSISGDIAFE